MPVNPQDGGDAFDDSFDGAVDDARGLDDLDDIVLDDDFVAGGVKEAGADERIAKAQRIARSNDRLRSAGEISDGTGKPAYRRMRRSAPWIAVGAVVAIAIVVIALIAR